jgi:hypothetical protein
MPDTREACRGQVIAAVGTYGAAVVGGPLDLDDGETDSWRAVSGIRRGDNAAVVELRRNVVLALGGVGGQSTSDLYDVRSEEWFDGGDMHSNRSMPSVVRLADGRVLVVGGDQAGTAEVFTHDGDQSRAPVLLPYASRR